MVDKRADRHERFEARVTDLMIRLTILALFIYWSLNLLRPFLPIFSWAVVLTVALFPVHAWLGRLMGGRNGLASVVVTMAVLLMLLGPVAALASSFVETVKVLTSAVHDGTLRVPPPPPGVATWPIVGDQLHRFWSLASTNLESAVHTYGPALLPARQTLLTILSSMSGDVVRFVIAVIVSGFLFGPGKSLAQAGRQFARRIIAPRGAMFVDLAGATIRNVSRGVVGVALLQAVLAGIIFQLAGMPGAGLIAFVTLILCLVQIGSMLVIVPAVVWAWMTMTTGSALIFTVAMIPLPVLDNVLKPILMARGLTTPTLVILLGVIGGTISYGLIGLFLGPIVLAVFYDLLVTWARFKYAPDPLDGTSS